MRLLAPEYWAGMREWLLPERPCALIGWHTLATGCGSWWVDRWPEPRSAVAFTGGNLALLGEAESFSTSAFETLIQELLENWDRVFMDVPEAFVPALQSALQDQPLWQRVVYTTDRPLPTALDTATLASGAVRRLGAGDAAAIAALDEDIAWISDTMGGPALLAQRQTAFGAFVSGRLVSVAAPFYVGERFEELGVVTQAEFRGAGWSTRCATAVVADIQARDRLPCWSTTPDNSASRRIAEKIGFAHTGDTVQFMSGEPIPGALPAT